ncbi:MAG: acyltransferase [Pseudomonadota bacterium]
MNFDAYRSCKRFVNLDGLRFCCILAVLWHHQIPLNDATRWQIFSRGFVGVDFFFVISGFLITTLLLREKSNTGQISLKRFYWRRALRILPPYFLIVTAVTLYFGVVNGQNAALERAPYYYFFLANFLEGDTAFLSPTWSLSVEEQYYLLWPLMLIAVAAPRIPWLVLVLIIVNVVISSNFLPALLEGEINVGQLRFNRTSAMFAPILIGSLAALTMHERRGYQGLAKTLGNPWALLVLVISLVVLLQWAPQSLAGLPNLVMHLIMAAFLVSVVIQEKNPLSSMLQNPLIVRIGAVSYGIYLYHMVARHVVNKGLNTVGIESEWAALVLYAVLSYVMAEISFRIWESFFLRFKNDDPRVLFRSWLLSPQKLLIRK